MSVNRLTNLAMVAGAALVGLSNFIYQVDPGEKALIMNNFTGLERKVYNQGYHFRIPGIEVLPAPPRNTSSTTLGSSRSTSTSPPAPRICRPLPSR